MYIFILCGSFICQISIRYKMLFNSRSAKSSSWVIHSSWCCVSARSRFCNGQFSIYVFQVSNHSLCIAGNGEKNNNDNDNNNENDKNNNNNNKNITYSRYHHALTLFYCWWSYSSEPVFQRVGLVANYTVHSAMYTLDRLTD